MYLKITYKIQSCKLKNLYTNWIHGLLCKRESTDWERMGYEHWNGDILAYLDKFDYNDASFLKNSTYEQLQRIFLYPKH